MFNRSLLLLLEVSSDLPGVCLASASRRKHIHSCLTVTRGCGVYLVKALLSRFECFQIIRIVISDSPVNSADITFNNPRQFNWSLWNVMQAGRSNVSRIWYCDRGCGERKEGRAKKYEGRRTILCSKKKFCQSE